jgi:quinol monooxygenase YgiN
MYWQRGNAPDCQTADQDDSGWRSKETIMHTRLFFGEIQQGKYDEAWQILTDYAQRVKQQKGCILQQVLRHGNEVVGITTWDNQEDLAAYANGEIARELFRRITPLLMGVPRVQTFEVKMNLCDPAAMQPV